MLMDAQNKQPIRLHTNADHDFAGIGGHYLAGFQASPRRGALIWKHY